MEKLKVHLRLMKSFPKIYGVLLFGVSIFMIYFGYLIFLGMASFDVLGFSSRAVAYTHLDVYKRQGQHLQVYLKSLVVQVSL